MSDSDETATEPALAIVNARIWTGDERRPWADALLVRGPRIIGVGSSAEIRKRAGAAATIVDGKSMMVLPSVANGRIVAGFPASVMLVERAVEGSPSAHGTEEIVLSLEDGVVMIDRDSLTA